MTMISGMRACRSQYSFNRVSTEFMLLPGLVNECLPLSCQPSLAHIRSGRQCAGLPGAPAAVLQPAARHHAALLPDAAHDVAAAAEAGHRLHRLGVPAHRGAISWLGLSVGHTQAQEVLYQRQLATMSLAPCCNEVCRRCHSRIHDKPVLAACSCSEVGISSAL